MIRVKTAREEFLAGKSGGYVYGYVIRRKAFPVYVELGIEREYQLSASDDPNTEYRLFRRCNVLFAETDELLDREEYIWKSTDVVVVIYT